MKSSEIQEMAIDIQWLGQAGFILTTPKGKHIAIDPYLGDSCERLVGFKRIMPAPFSIESFAADYLFLSHEHPDHFDVDLIGTIQHSTIQIFGCKGCIHKWQAEGFKADGISVVSPFNILTFDGFTVYVMHADHGAQCPDAIGFIFDFGFVRVYFAGDTAYSLELLTKVRELCPEIALLPINGMYGNLNAEQATQFAGDIGSKAVIPCHYWMFVEHGSNPLAFRNIMKEKLPDVKAIFLANGEHYLYVAT